jgi:hypothetical protein
LGVKPFLFSLKIAVMEFSSREKKLSVGILLFLGLAVFVFYGVLSTGNSYEKFEIDSLDSDVERVTAECTCYGSLAVAQSYPPQYNCQGYEMCSSVNYTRPRR